MSFLGRSFSIIRGVWRIILIGLTSSAITAGILFLLETVAKGNLDNKAINLPLGIIGGAVAGYAWGRYFGRSDFKRHKVMMEKEGIEVFGNE